MLGRRASENFKEKEYKNWKAFEFFQLLVHCVLNQPKITKFSLLIRPIKQLSISTAPTNINKRPEFPGSA
mgnify:CR=1 FL=1